MARRMSSGRGRSCTPGIICVRSARGEGVPPSGTHRLIAPAERDARDRWAARSARIPVGWCENAPHPTVASRTAEHLPSTRNGAGIVPCVGILRLSHVDITVPDLDLASAYYTRVMGMLETERTPDRAFFKCWDEEDHHSLSVRYDPRVGIDLFSFKVEDEDDLEELERRIERYGLRVHRVSAGEEVGQGTSIRFETPSGHTMELVHGVERVGGLIGKLNPSPSPMPESVKGREADRRVYHTWCSACGWTGDIIR